MVPLINHPQNQDEAAYLYGWRKRRRTLGLMKAATPAR